MTAAIFSNWIHRFLFIVYLGLFLSMFCGFRVMSSSCVGSLLGLSILLAIFDRGHYVRKPFLNYFVWGCLLFYGLQLIGLLYTHNHHSGMQQIQVKISLFFIPVALYFSNYANSKFRERLMPYYVLLIAIVLLICFFIAALQYRHNHDTGVFFYHQLVKPFNQHAVYFSIYIFIGLVYILEQTRQHIYIWNKSFQFLIIGYFLFFTVLLASKLVIIFSFLSIFIYLLIYIKKTTASINFIIISCTVGILLLGLLMITPNPVSRRFKDLFNGNLDVIENTSFNPGNYFNGLQFRLLQWKIVGKILTEQNAWLFGVSPGNAQDLVNDKYISFNMYVGDGKSPGKGFLNYNTHNQFLQSVLQTGIIGLMAFIMMCAGFIRMMLYNRNTEFYLVGTLLLLYSFVESILQTQFGSLLFTFFPLFLFYTTLPQTPENRASMAT